MAEQEVNREKHASETQSETLKLLQPVDLLAPEKLALIKKRVAENFYNREDVLKEIVEKLIAAEIFQSFLMLPPHKKK